MAEKRKGNLDCIIKMHPVINFVPARDSKYLDFFEKKMRSRMNVACNPFMSFIHRGKEYKKAEMGFLAVNHANCIIGLFSTSLSPPHPKTTYKSPVFFLCFGQVSSRTTRACRHHLGI